MRRDRPFVRALGPFLVLALGGCATQVTLPPLPDCHPASAAAPSAERARPSDLLQETPPVPAAEPEVLEETEGMREMEPTEEREEMEEMEGHEHHQMHPPPPPPPSPPPPGARGAAP